MDYMFPREFTHKHDAKYAKSRMSQEKLTLSRQKATGQSIVLKCPRPEISPFGPKFSVPSINDNLINLDEINKSWRRKAR